MSDSYDPNYVSQKNYFVVGVKVLIFNQDAKFLLLQRSEKSGGGGKWSLPGGALDKGEDVFDAAKREVSEETKLTIKELVLLSSRTSENESESVVILGVKSLLNSGETVLNWEHDNFVWVTKNEALQHDLSSDARFFIEKL